MRRELSAADIHDPRLRAAYEECRRLNARHGKTYYLATQLLPAAKRPFVHALYGFARYADDIVDSDSTRDPAVMGAALTELAEDLAAARSRRREPRHPVVTAVTDTAERWRIPDSYFEAFLDSMRMDLTVTSYDTFADLQRYMYGSAVVIGLEMLPILEPSEFDTAASGAADLATAFQLANFIRDVGEDLDRGRIYLPLDELAECGVSPATLASRQVDDALRTALAQQIDRVHALSDSAARTVRLLHPAVRDCIETARILYCDIADQVAASGYDVFGTRARVPMSRRLAVAGGGWRRARRSRRRFGEGATAYVPLNLRDDAARAAGR